MGKPKVFSGAYFYNLSKTIINGDLLNLIGFFIFKHFALHLMFSNYFPLIYTAWNTSYFNIAYGMW